MFRNIRRSQSQNITIIPPTRPDLCFLTLVFPARFPRQQRASDFSFKRLAMACNSPKYDANAYYGKLMIPNVKSGRGLQCNRILVLTFFPKDQRKYVNTNLIKVKKNVGMILNYDTARCGKGANLTTQWGRRLWTSSWNTI